MIITCTQCGSQHKVKSPAKGKLPPCPSCGGACILGPAAFEPGERPGLVDVDLAKVLKEETLAVSCRNCDFSVHVPVQYHGLSSKCLKCEAVIFLVEEPLLAETQGHKKTIRFACQKCGLIHNEPVDQRGKIVTCAKCGTSVRVGIPEGSKAVKQPPPPQKPQANAASPAQAPQKAPANNGPGPKQERREEERVQVAHVRADFGVVVGEYPVKDLDPKGLGFLFRNGDWDFQIGQQLTFTLLLGNAVLLSEVKARVTRVGSDTVGCIFAKMTANKKEKLRAYVRRLRQREPQSNAANGYKTHAGAPQRIQ